MQDEEGYTVLNLRPKMGTASRPSADGIQAWETLRLTDKSEFTDSPANLRGYKITIGVLGVWSVVATLAVITLSILGKNSNRRSHGCFQGSSHEGLTGAAPNAPASRGAQWEEGNGAECGARLSHLVSRLSQALCAPINSSSLEGAGCKICPPDWLPHGAKCYWFSTESKIWARSREDCSARSARMVVIQEQDEMEFLGNSIQEKYLVWTGLSANVTGRKWTWVDGSLLNQTLFPVKGSAEENSCGVIKGSQIQSETCSGEYRWICQKDAIQIDSGTSDL
ncbi:killer cell lectin-like receptor subfamily F member 1 [Terrapene carolina triunguis]|uniref:killer cell lectin-like receptor subfamily F member 1 n=1 Tax=Terrapene triunguis TaxID=2587831 RepID=UPI00115686F5|nr:killer cell lectin-like receptor subfamily F member 1 [Terrapene carolina triunguis]